MPVAQPITLSTPQAMRYSRQIMLAGFDLDKQEILLNSRVLQIGVGGLGCAAAQYLVAAGVGKLTLVDDDQVELTNLQRQVLHREASVGEYKSHSAKASLQQLNSQCELVSVTERLDDQALAAAIAQHDLVLDCSDNLATREQINALCYQAGTALVSGAAIRMEGQVSCFTFKPEHACYQCLSSSFGEQNLSCMEAGVMSPVVGIIGATQALEAIKLLTDFGQSLVNKLLIFDATNSEWRSFHLVKNPQCKVCGVTENLNGESTPQG